MNYKETKSIIINGVLYLEHGSSVERRLSAGEEVPIRYAVPGGQILTEEEIREKMRTMSVPGA